MYRRIFALIVLSLMFMSLDVFAQAQKAPAINKSIKTCVYIQPQFYTFDSQKSQSDGAEFFIRRAKFVFKGQLNKNIKLLVGLLSKNFGRAGDTKVNTELKDAWIEYGFSKALKLNVGLIKLPFSRHTQQAGRTLHGLDYHSSFLVNTGIYGHRDMGMVARGLLLKNKIDYRLALVNGKVDASGADKHLRHVGRLGFNFFDAEPEYFWAGTYLGKRKVLSFGVSWDLEPGVGGSNGTSLHRRIAFDALADIPMGENGVVATFNFYHFNEGTKRPKGKGLWADLGYRIKKIEPLIALEWYQPDSGDKGKRLAILPGLNYWIKGHAANIKAEFGLIKLDGADEWDKAFTLQSQLAL